MSRQPRVEPVQPLRNLADTGRRNYLLASTDSGGGHAAVIYPLIGTAKLDGGAPEAWLRHVQAHMSTTPSTALTSSCPGIARQLPTV